MQLTNGQRKGRRPRKVKQGGPGPVLLRELPEDIRGLNRKAAKGSLREVSDETSQGRGAYPELSWLGYSSHLSRPISAVILAWYSVRFSALKSCRWTQKQSRLSTPFCQVQALRNLRIPTKKSHLCFKDHVNTGRIFGNLQ